MQMKMVKDHQKFDKKQIRLLLEKEDAFISNLFVNLEVPESIDDDDINDQYLLATKKPAKNDIGKPLQMESNRAQTAEELQDRLEIMRNKMKSKKSKPSERTLKKKQEKKLKKSKESKKHLVTAAKSIKNEKSKGGKVKAEDEEDAKTDLVNGVNIKSEAKAAKTFNEDGRIVFSKFEFAARPSQAKKSKKDKTVKDPKLLLQKIKKQKEEISDLIEKGETDKADALKQDMAWKKAFDKTDGKKVKDNTTLLQRALKRKKVDKKKSKTEWKKREERVEKDQGTRQKKREANINKKKDEKKKHKLKKMAKRGRVIPGY